MLNEAERLRRLHRRRRVADRQQATPARRQARHPGRQQRRPARGRAADAAARPLRRVRCRAVPLLDMLRYHKFTDRPALGRRVRLVRRRRGVQVRSTPTRRTTTSSRDAHYPPTLMTTADTDDRVVPGHSFKFAAALQARAGRRPAPILIRIETHAGHGGGKPTDEDDRRDRRRAELPLPCPPRGRGGAGPKAAGK